MATYNLGSTGVTNPGVSWQGSNKVGVVTVDIDLTKRLGANVPAGGYAAGDVLQLADFPIGMYVLYATQQVLAVDATMTYALATTGTAIAFVTAGQACSSAGVPLVCNVTSGLVSAASILTLTLGGTVVANGSAKLRFCFTVANHTN